MFFDMNIKNSYKDFYDECNSVEKERLETLVQRFPNKKFKYETSYASGIGQNMYVIIDGKQYDITDYDSW